MLRPAEFKRRRRSLAGAEASTVNTPEYMANDSYTVGWICAISTEYVAAQAFLDEKHKGSDHVSAMDNKEWREITEKIL